jgi:ABC-type multidrug transport system ATPase subunit
MTGATLERALRRTPTFAALGDAGVLALAVRSTHQAVPQGTVIIREGTDGDSLFVLIKGQARVVSDAVQERVLLARLGPGEVFGERSVLTAEPRSAAVIAETDCELAVLSRQDLIDLARDVPELRSGLEALMARRTQRDGSLRGDAATLIAIGPATDRVTIGRDDSNDVVIDEPAVSAFHAEFRMTDGKLRLVDRNSEAGTYHNRRPITEVDVADGDEIWIGSSKLYYVDGLLKQFRAARGIRVEARGIGRTVSGGRRILREVDLAIYPGELVAIVGPSGAGKTTLLHTLLGLTPPTTGEVFYDSQPLEIALDAFRRTLGYVPQDDIVHPDLTVEQSLRYAGRLRLPHDTTNEELTSRIERVLGQLDLTAEMNSPVRNLSGGQRKRASIGIELQSEPRICFLDEPTSGLDPGLDEQMMHLLRGLADEGRTVVLTTHATRNIEVCDRIVIVSGGLIVFAGTPQEALAHFRVDDFVSIYRVLAERTPEQLAAEFRSSEVYTRNVTSRLVTPVRSPEQQAQPVPRRPAGFREAVFQFRHLLGRDLRVTLSDRVNMAMRIAGPVVLAGSLLLTFESRIFAIEEENGGNAISAITLLYLAAAVSLFLGAFTAANVITRESAIYRRERLVNLSPAAYVLSKVGILTVFAIVQSAALVAVLQVGFDFPVPAGTLIPQLFGAFAITAMAGVGMGLLVSALSPNADRAATLVVLLLIPQLIFAGSTVPRSEMREPAKLISDATMSKWSLELLGGMTRLDASLFDQSFKSVPGFPGEQMVVRVPDRPFEQAFKGDPALRWAVLSGFFLAFLVTTYAVQRSKGQRHRRRWGRHRS